MFKNIDIKTFDLESLVGRKLDIRAFKEGDTELIAAKDMETGEFFVLKEISHPQAIAGDT